MLFSCNPHIRHAEVQVMGNCEMCRETIENALKIPGILKASWSPETRILEVDFNESIINLNDIRKKVADAGYDSDSLKAPLENYSRLHECCRYRENLP